MLWFFVLRPSSFVLRPARAPEGQRQRQQPDQHQRRAAPQHRHWVEQRARIRDRLAQEIVAPGVRLATVKDRLVDHIQHSFERLDPHRRPDHEHGQRQAAKPEQIRQQRAPRGRRPPADRSPPARAIRRAQLRVGQHNSGHEQAGPGQQHQRRHLAQQRQPGHDARPNNRKPASGAAGRPARQRRPKQQQQHADRRERGHQRIDMQQAAMRDQKWLGGPQDRRQQRNAGAHNSAQQQVASATARLFVTASGRRSIAR